ncbi:MAG: TIGR00159 family protein [Candidatus Marinimicrobia bacterium]|nr:TIGR00159 family protein [Candidatus Neomarinimicrobiota bacterium]
MVLFEIGFLTITLIDLIDLTLVSWLFHKIYLYFRGTRAGQMLVGLIILMIGSFVFNAFGFSASSWLVNQFQTVLVVAFVILFQPELRRLLIYVGQTRFFQQIFRVGAPKTITAIVEATSQLKEKGWGGLIVIQRETGLRSYKDQGTLLRAEVTTPLLLSIFSPSSPLHDGAVIVQNDLIDSAACILPLTESKMVDPEMGTRHRAVLGISEETDAIVILISEERSQISVAENSRFVEIDMDDTALTEYLNDKMFISSGD